MEKYFAYAVIFDANGNIIVGLKNQLSFFFSGVRSSNGINVNGGGHYCFPGGEMKTDEYANEAAARELYEETRYNTMNLLYDGFLRKGGESTPRCDYHYFGVYFRVPPGLDIYAICSTINTTLQNTANLVNSTAGTAVPAGVDWTQYPIDNELASCQVVPINAVLAQGNMYFDDRSNITDWYYDIAWYLKYRILNPIPNSTLNPLPTPLITSNP